jgi:YfiH family protein
VRSVTEEQLPGGLPLWRQPEWAERFDWLVQGTTGRGEAEEPFDLGLFGEAPVGRVLGRWAALRRGLGMRAAVHARQVHGAELALHAGPVEAGLSVGEGVDGHLSRAPGVLLSISVADCVPVFLVDAERRAVAAVHAGWRGVAGEIVERAVARMAADFGSEPHALWLHAGPAICGRCYEVGPEVHRAVRPAAPAPPAPEPIDLRAAIAERALACGLGMERVSVSTLCTRCTPGAFFSHRAGSPMRQMGVLGVRP